MFYGLVKFSDDLQGYFATRESQEQLLLLKSMLIVPSPGYSDRSGNHTKAGRGRDSGGVTNGKRATLAF